MIGKCIIFLGDPKLIATVTVLHDRLQIWPFAHVQVRIQDPWDEFERNGLPGDAVYPHARVRLRRIDAAQSWFKKCVLTIVSLGRELVECIIRFTGGGQRTRAHAGLR